MQKESINLHSQNLKYSKNTPFRHFKFGQHKNLVKFIFYYSMVFLMFQGLHRRQICNFWIYRTPDMNFASFLPIQILFKRNLKQAARWRYPICRYRFGIRTNRGPRICIKWTAQIRF
jgi:hypothetical protein